MKGAAAGGPAAGVFFVVLGLQLWLVAVAGTDIPFHDQWNIEGEWLYPQFKVGGLGFIDLLHPLNEHRITSTHAWNLLLFQLNGQWDPMVQLVANAIPRAATAGAFVWWLTPVIGRWRSAVLVAFAFLPHLGWHNVLWGNQSQVYFAVALSGATLAWLSPPVRSNARTIGGLLAGSAALLAMGPAALVPVALLGLGTMRACAARRVGPDTWRECWPALVLLLLAVSLRVNVPEHHDLQPASVAQALVAAGRLLAWPHEPIAAGVMVLPLAALVVARIARRRSATNHEDFVIALGFWAGAIALATAWMRGGSTELLRGVPSRYADFIVLLPIANACAAFLLIADFQGVVRRRAVLTGRVWAVFVLVGWLGLSAQLLRGIVLPRAADRLAPVRLAVEFQRTRDYAVFTGQPRLLVPHPNPVSIEHVLDDPRLHGALPPSLQPEAPVGPLSRGVRFLLGHQ